MNSTLLFATLVLTMGVKSTAAFVTIRPQTYQHKLSACASTTGEADGTSVSLSPSASSNERRHFLHSIAVPAAASVPLIFINERSSALAASEECDILCRQQRYDSYMDSQYDEGTNLPPAQPIPKVTNKITYVVQMIIDIGAKRDNINAGYIRFGLYGDDAPASVKQMLFFLTKGVTSMDQKSLEDRLEVDYIPVSMRNGSVQTISPGEGIVFGVPSQSKAYAENKGLRTAGSNFIPQNRPMPTLEGEKFPRPHSCAGLISIPSKGIGYDSDSSNLDEIYSSAFTITDASLPALDKPPTAKKSAQQQPPSHRVIGQIIDDESMQFLERLATLPVQKKLGKGSSGPPLLKVRVRDVDVQKVK
ncbi:hypothetical protein ACHAWT_010201 [Skeletonema menzelii]|mmetsp:Transcript_20828/g.34350  ORF Transcript_20828/g.34350 Transcript_20828/m.34350 type:complete len:361 (+) Transcript_20828:10-1092(+)